MDSNRLEVGQVRLLSVQVDIFCECCVSTPEYAGRLVDVAPIINGKEVFVAHDEMLEKLESTLEKLSSKGWKHAGGKFYCPDCCETMGRKKKDCGCPDCGGSLVG